MTLGRLHDAERVLLAIDNPNDVLINRSVLAEVRDDTGAMREYLIKGLADGWLVGRSERLVKAGLWKEARTMIDAPARTPVVEAQNDIGRGTLELATGHPEAAIPYLRKGLFVAKGWFSSEYQNGCESLATALVHIGRREEAIQELEQCAALSPRFVGLFNTSYWMRLRLRLADEYRAVGRLVDAQTIDNDLRRLLAFADADHPLVKRVNAR